MCVQKKLGSLEISLTIGCKLDCKYCPQKLLLSKYFEKDKKCTSKLSFEDFKVALNNVEKNSTISFCGMSEPFHNERCADMIVYAHEQGYKIALLTTLVGMKKEDYEKIKEIPFDSFVLHIPDEEGNSKFTITDEYLELAKLVIDNIEIDYYSCHGKVHPVMQGLIDSEKHAGIALGDRAGNLEIQLNRKCIKTGAIVCFHGSEKQMGTWPAPVMLPDGRLVLCCQDYGMKHVLGNLLVESWDTIYNSAEFQKILKGMEDSSCDILCRNCTDARAVETLPSMKIGRMVQERKESTGADNNASEVIANLAEAEQVCVFGLGKLFRDHFFQEYWHIGLNVNYLVDNNPDMHGKVINEIPCISSKQLSELSNAFVVIFVRNSEEIERQLEMLGIRKYISIDGLIDELSGNAKVGKRSLTKSSIVK